MLYLKVLILKLFSVYTLTSSAIKVSEVTSLHHKAFNHSMENSVFKGNNFTRSLRLSRLSSTKLSKVFSSFGSHILKEFHSNSSSLLIIDADIKVYSGVAWSRAWMRHYMILQTCLYWLSF
jgi:hypothetical protein